MALLEIAQLGQPVLRMRAEEVPPEEIGSADIQSLLNDMMETLIDANGAGLAAPQVFESKRIFLACVHPPEKGNRPEAEIFINPRLSHRSAEMDAGWEGCLSFMELSVMVPRHRSLQVDYLDRQGNERKLRLSGFAARVVQHEYDHLNGVLIIDRATSTHDIVKSSEMETVLAARHVDEEDEDDVGKTTLEIPK